MGITIFSNVINLQDRGGGGGGGLSGASIVFILLVVECWLNKWLSDLNAKKIKQINKIILKN